jgi:replicative DNA helicase
MTIERLHFDDEQSGRLPPNNQEAEEAVLGCVLLDRSMIGKLAGLLDEHDFYRARNGLVYGAMLALYQRNEPVDYLLLIDELDRQDLLEEAGGTTYVAGLLGAVPTPIHAEHYARIVADAAFMRRLISAGGKISTIGFQHQMNPSEALDNSRQILDAISNIKTAHGPRLLEDALRDFLDDVQASVDSGGSTQGVPTGMQDLDKILGGGMQRTDMLLLAARPAMGKTSAAMHMASSLGARGGSVLVFSLEMAFKQLVGRLLTTESGIELRRIRAGDYTDTEVRRLGAAMASLANKRIWVDDSTDIDVYQIRERARRLHTQSKLDMVVVDHVQLISGGGGRRRRDENRTQEVSEITKQLKNMARELDVPVLVLSQLSRDVEKRQNKVPTLGDLRDSGSLEQDADVIMFLYKDSYYNQDSEKQGITELHVAKHRNGPTGQVSLLFDERTTRYMDLDLS